MTRKLAYRPIAHLFAFIIFVALSLTQLDAAHFVVLAGFLAYVALSHVHPKPAAFRTAAGRYL